MVQWFQSGVADMALHRAQFLPLGPSAIMHRFVCPSPARDCLLIVRARGYFPRALNSYCIGEAGAQFRTQWPHSAFALEHDRRTDLTRIVFGPVRPTRIVCRFGPAGSNRFSVRAGRLKSFLSSRRVPDRGLHYFCLITRSARSRPLCDRQMRLLSGGLGHVFPIRTPPGNSKLSRPADGNTMRRTRADVLSGKQMH